MAFEFLSLFIPVMHIAWGNFKSIKLINQNNFKSPIFKSLHIMYFSLFFLLKFEFNLCIWNLSKKLLYFLICWPKLWYRLLCRKKKVKVNIIRSKLGRIRFYPKAGSGYSPHGSATLVLCLHMECQPFLLQRSTKNH